MGIQNLKSTTHPTPSILEQSLAQDINIKRNINKFKFKYTLVHLYFHNSKDKDDSDSYSLKFSN